MSATQSINHSWFETTSGGAIAAADAVEATGGDQVRIRASVERLGGAGAVQSTAFRPVVVAAAVAAAVSLLPSLFFLTPFSDVFFFFFFPRLSSPR